MTLERKIILIHIFAKICEHLAYHLYLSHSKKEYGRLTKTTSWLAKLFKLCYSNIFDSEITVTKVTFVSQLPTYLLE